MNQSHSGPRRTSLSCEDWEPALSQLRALSPLRADGLLRAWLGRLGIPDPWVASRTAGSVTYRATFYTPALAVPFALRLHQRRSRLQVHHVEAFLGYLHRSNIPAGYLVCTGGVVPQAVVVAGNCRCPQARVLSGPQFAAELAERRVGLVRRSLRRWVLASRGRAGGRPSP